MWDQSTGKSVLVTVTSLVNLATAGVEDRLDLEAERTDIRVDNALATALFGVNTLIGELSETVTDLSALGDSLLADIAGLNGEVTAHDTLITDLTTVVAGKASASALSALDTRVTAAEGVNTSQATSITSLNTTVAGKADASALTALTTRVTSAEGVNTSQATLITDLTTVVAGKASASALSALDTRVTSAEGVNTSQATAITSLNTTVAGKADASALTALTTRVTSAEGVNTTQAGQITTLISDVAGKASASALSALDTRVTAAEGVNTSQATSITSLNTTVAGKASASALTTLTATVTQIDLDVDAVSAAVTKLSAGTGTDLTSALFQMSAVSAPAGWSSRIALQAKGGVGDTFKSAGLYLDTVSGGASRVVIEADKFVVHNGAGRDPPGGCRWRSPLGRPRYGFRVDRRR